MRTWWLTRPCSVAVHPLDDHQRRILDRFTDAWRRCDIDALAALERDGIATITGFPSPDLFERFGLPSDCE